jgi:aminoglycoside phosphotransferase
VDVFITFENKANDHIFLPDQQLVSIHHQFAPALAWLEVSDRMSQQHDLLDSSKPQGSVDFAERGRVTRGWVQRYTQSASRAFQYIWTRLPVCLRAFSYQRLASLGQILYGHTGSYQTYRLPFNLYLRIGSRDWAPKHEAELQSLKMIETYTRIPAPRGIDIVQYLDQSYLLMTGVPGQRLGPMLATMTDKQVDVVTQDLKGYIAELRRIPTLINSKAQICNSLGRGILNWRIGDSQRKELIFHNESDFNQFLTYNLPLGEDALVQISKSHGAKHEIVFTHADLNPKNILVDENNRISGIVDWECAGWYPEYWECSKMHFTVRATSRWIADVIDQIFPMYYDEVQAENLLCSIAPSW